MKFGNVYWEQRALDDEAKSASILAIGDSWFWYPKNNLLNPIFNVLGASRVGVGMLPRGEVALIIAGIGLTRGVIDEQLFGVAIMMTVITTLVAPVALVPLFRNGGSGRRNGAVDAGIGNPGAETEKSA